MRSHDSLTACVWLVAHLISGLRCAKCIRLTFRATSVGYWPVTAALWVLIECGFSLKQSESCKRWENPIKKLLFVTFPDHLSAVFFSLHKEVKEIAFPSIFLQVTHDWAPRSCRALEVNVMMMEGKDAKLPVWGILPAALLLKLFHSVRTLVPYRTSGRERGGVWRDRWSIMSLTLIKVRPAFTLVVIVVKQSVSLCSECELFECLSLSQLLLLLPAAQGRVVKTTNCDEDASLPSQWRGTRSVSGQWPTSKRSRVLWGPECLQESKEGIIRKRQGCQPPHTKPHIIGSSSIKEHQRRFDNRSLRD